MLKNPKVWAVILSLALGALSIYLGSDVKELVCKADIPASDA